MTPNYNKIKKVFRREELLNMLPKGSVGLELGTARGDFAKIILRIVEPKELHLVDNWTNELHYDPVVNRKIFFENFNYDHPIVKIHEMDSLDAVNLFDDEYLDWIYIDCNHYFYAAYQDLISWRQKVKNDGRIMVHDYCVLPPEHGGDGVLKAVDKLVHEEKLYIIEAIATEPFQSVSLKKIGKLP